MRGSPWLLAGVACCVTVVGLVGCGPANPEGRLAISGTVTFEGQPLDQGSIEFTALEAGSSIRSGAVVEGGKFSIEAHKGLPPGKFRVRVYSAAEAAGGAAPEMPGEATEVAKQRIPAEWNVNSTQEITVTSSGSNDFQFDIK